MLHNTWEHYRTRVNFKNSRQHHFDHMIVFWKKIYYFSPNSYRLVSQIVNETMEKGMATFLNYYISGRFAVERFAIEIIRRRSGGYVHGGFTFFSIHLSIWKNTVHPISDRAYNQICILWFSWIILRIWNLKWKHGWIFSVWKRSNLELLSAIHNFEPDIKASSIFDQGHKEKKAKSTTLMQCMCSVRYVFI